MERKEKIAFVFPAAQDANGNEGPILNFQCEKLQVGAKITVAAAFVGLDQLEEYLISLDVTDMNGVSVLKDPDRAPLEIPVTANDPEAEPTDVPGFLRAEILVNMAIVGVHTIKMSIASASEPNKVLHDMEARFRVTLKGENK